MRKTARRTPRGYDGTGTTSRKFGDILPEVLNRITKAHSQRPDLILASWDQVVGPQVARFTEPESLIEGTLVVRVKNSTLYSLLAQNEKHKILQILRQKFPEATIRNIRFRLG